MIAIRSLREGLTIRRYLHAVPLVAAATLLVGGLNGCSSTETDPVDDDEHVADAATITNAWVACYEDKGIDAEAGAGSVSFDKNGSLGAAESFALVQQCEAELQAADILGIPETNNAALTDQYRDFEKLHECLVADGFELPDLVSLEVYTEDPSQLVHPLSSLQDKYGLDVTTRARKACTSAV